MDRREADELAAKHGYMLHSERGSNNMYLIRLIKTIRNIPVDVFIGEGMVSTKHNDCCLSLTGAKNIAEAILRDYNVVHKAVVIEEGIKKYLRNKGIDTHTGHDFYIREIALALYEKGIGAFTQEDK